MMVIGHCIITGQKLGVEGRVQFHVRFVRLARVWCHDNLRCVALTPIILYLILVRCATLSTVHTLIRAKMVCIMMTAILLI